MRWLVRFCGKYKYTPYFPQNMGYIHISMRHDEAGQWVKILKILSRGSITVHMDHGLGNHRSNGWNVLKTSYNSLKYLPKNCLKTVNKVKELFYRWCLISSLIELNFITHRKYFPLLSRSTLKCCTVSWNLRIKIFFVLHKSNNRANHQVTYPGLYAGHKKTVR